MSIAAALPSAPAARSEPRGERRSDGQAAITKELVEIVSGAEAL